jgi:glutamyl-Q tRNA(Asp) synthetase
MSAAQPVFRFAPSPTGRLHLGHAYSALLNEAVARQAGGLLLLRIEDIDGGRARPEFAQGLIEDLAWLGVRFDGVTRRQSEHFPLYRAARDRLAAAGLLFRCRCTRADIADATRLLREETPRDPEGAPLYPGTCRMRQPGPCELVAERLYMRAALAAEPGPLGFHVMDEAGEAGWRVADPGRWGDVVIMRKDTPTSYHLACVVDDAAQGVTHVVRGADMEAATDVHVLLQRLLGLPTPVYRFHRLLLDADGRKLSKSRGSASLADLRAQGVTAAEIRARLGF